MCRITASLYNVQYYLVNLPRRGKTAPAPFNFGFRQPPGLHGPDLAHAFSLISRLRLQDNVLHKHKSFPLFVHDFHPHLFRPTALRITYPTGRRGAHTYTLTARARATSRLPPPSAGVTLIGTRFSPEKRRNARADINR